MDQNDPIRGFAFVAIKGSGPCSGVINIEDGYEALDIAETLIDAINGDDTFTIQLDDRT